MRVGHPTPPVASGPLHPAGCWLSSADPQPATRNRMMGSGRGIFLVFEGVEGAGKSTQVEMLAAWLSKHGVAHERVREPGGTAFGEEVRRLVLEGGEVPVRAELLLVLAARAALIEQRIAPALAAGKVIVADRFDLSTLAYQGVGRELGVDEVARLNRFATGDLTPDLTVYLDVPVSLGRARRGAWEEGDRIERAGRAFHERVAGAYALLADQRTDIERVDATAPAASVHGTVLERLRARFPETFARATG